MEDVYDKRVKVRIALDNLLLVGVTNDFNGCHTKLPREVQQLRHNGGAELVFKIWSQFSLSRLKKVAPCFAEIDDWWPVVLTLLFSRKTLFNKWSNTLPVFIIG